jgi:hypothetical protein
MSGPIHQLDQRCEVLRAAGIPASTICVVEKGRDPELSYGVRIAAGPKGPKRGLQVLVRDPLPKGFEAAAVKALAWLDEQVPGRQVPA